MICNSIKKRTLWLADKTTNHLWEWCSLPKTRLSFEANGYGSKDQAPSTKGQGPRTGEHNTET